MLPSSQTLSFSQNACHSSYRFWKKRNLPAFYFRCSSIGCEIIVHVSTESLLQTHIEDSCVQDVCPSLSVYSLAFCRQDRTQEVRPNHTEPTQRRAPPTSRSQRPVSAKNSLPAGWSRKLGISCRTTPLRRIWVKFNTSKRIEWRSGDQNPSTPSKGVLSGPTRREQPRNVTMNVLLFKNGEGSHQARGPLLRSHRCGPAGLSSNLSHG